MTERSQLKKLKKLLPDKRYVHTYIETPYGNLWAHWPRAEVIDYMTRHPTVRSTINGYSIVVLPEEGPPLFVETKIL